MTFPGARNANWVHDPSYGQWWTEPRFPVGGMRDHMTYALADTLVGVDVDHLSDRGIWRVAMDPATYGEESA
jgi:hypothetical protein